MAASRRLGVLAIMIVIAQPAWAHHPMGGTLPQTFLQGLLSGFGHPVIGVDHLAAIVGAEASPLVAYLLGLLIMQTAIGVVVYAAVRSLARWPARATGLTVAGVLVALAGSIATAAAAGLA